MSLNTAMKYQILSLIDITETHSRFVKENKLWHQQQNYLTVLQTIGLRANPTVNKSPEMQIQPTRGLGFGTRFKGDHAIWTFEFEIEYGGINLDELIQDFNYVPVIQGLDETIKLYDAVFETVDDKNRNIQFKQVD